MLLCSSVVEAILFPVSQRPDQVIERWCKLLCAVFESSLENIAFLGAEAGVLDRIRRLCNSMGLLNVSLSSQGPKARLLSSVALSSAFLMRSFSVNSCST